MKIDESTILDLQPAPPTTGAELKQEKYKFMSDTHYFWTKCMFSLKRGRISRREWRLFFMMLFSELKFFFMTGFLPDEKISKS